MRGGLPVGTPPGRPPGVQRGLGSPLQMTDATQRAVPGNHFNLEDAKAVELGERKHKYACFLLFFAVFDFAIFLLFLRFLGVIFFSSSWRLFGDLFVVGGRRSPFRFPLE